MRSWLSCFLALVLCGCMEEESIRTVKVPVSAAEKGPSALEKGLIGAAEKGSAAAENGQAARAEKGPVAGAEKGLVGAGEKVPVGTAENPPQPSGPYRILGAIFSEGETVWVFKLTGSEAALKEVETAFDAFLKTIRFPNGFTNPPLWTLPSGWNEGQGHAMRYATIKIAGGPLEVSVMRTGGGLMPNVQRWVEQVGSQNGLAECLREFKTDHGATGHRVDVTGPNNPASSMPMMAPRR